MRLALFEPDIPQNAGTMIRTAVCLGVPVDLIEPCGFVWGDRHFRRAGMDYLERAGITRHESWETFLAASRAAHRRLVLLTTKGTVRHIDFRFGPDDVLIVGRESAGAPEAVHAAADARLVVPMAAGERSLNVAVTAALVLGEALRQTGGFGGDA
ncbi:tRNA (cytidine(34)-2'-O)-methyltransferase [Shumkonia mesophila]|uniref:tRNA (cytidine(34)-2'-O)-methyltransferase n=1 Tax=Shumkonia mesophila TaxID=2838854 RepID=UPI002934CF81|nr:tRNA (cytidine(34)-2'-O)-methyltransferase [Shumkonia mesophila]